MEGKRDTKGKYGGGGGGISENGEETRDETENVEGGRGQFCCGGCAVGCKEGRGTVLEAGGEGRLLYDFFRTINLAVTKVCVCLPPSDVSYKLNSISAHSEKC